MKKTMKKVKLLQEVKTLLNYCRKCSTDGFFFPCPQLRMSRAAAPADPEETLPSRVVVLNCRKRRRKLPQKKNTKQWKEKEEKSEGEPLYLLLLLLVFVVLICYEVTWPAAAQHSSFFCVRFLFSGEKWQTAPIFLHFRRRQSYGDESLFVHGRKKGRKECDQSH